MLFLLYRRTVDGVFDDFPKISDHFPKISENSPKLEATGTLPNIFWKISEVSEDKPRTKQTRGFKGVPGQLGASVSLDWRSSLF